MGTVVHECVTCGTQWPSDSNAVAHLGCCACGGDLRRITPETETLNNGKGGPSICKPPARPATGGSPDGRPPGGSEKNRAHGELATALGVSEDVLRAIRRTQLVEGEHYEGDRPVRYTPAGLAQICQILGVWPESLPDAAERAAAREPLPDPPGWGELTVQRAMGNPRFVLCLSQDGERVELQVRSNLHFVRGMKVPAGHYTVSRVRGGLALLIGKEPRQRGRW